MSTIPNVKLRQLPMGGPTLRQRYVYHGMGQDFSTDTFDINSAPDVVDTSLTAGDPLAAITGSSTIPTIDTSGLSPSDLAALTIAEGGGVSAASQAAASQVIAAGGGTSAASVAAQQAVIAAGGSPDQAAAAAQEVEYNAGATPESQAAAASAAVTAAGGTAAQAAAAATAALKAGSQILSSTGARRPSPVTVATAPASGVTYASALNALQTSSIISGVPNYIVLAAIVGFAIFAGGSRHK